MLGFYDGPHATPDPTDEGPVFLGIKNIHESGGLNLSDIRHISRAEYPRWTKRVVPTEGDIVFSYEATLHRYAIIPNGFVGCLGRRMGLIRVNPSIVDHKYLYYHFLSPYWRAFVEGVKISGATVDRLSILDFPKYRISLPPLPTQKKIASILSAYDELIENNNQRILLLEEMAEEIYKEWFVRMRFPGNETCKWFDKEGNEVPTGTKDALPEGWERNALRSYLEHYIGGGWGEDEPVGRNTLPAHVIRGTDIPGYKVGDLNYEVLRYHTASNLKSRRCIDGDIIFEVSGGTETQSLGRTVLISDKALERFEDDVIAASFCKLLRIDKNLTSPHYIYRLLNRMHDTGELTVFQVQSTGLSNYQFEDFINHTKVTNPTKEIRDLFDEIHSNFIDAIQTLGAKNEVLQQTRDLLLPRLISGKLDVEKLDIELQPETHKL